MEKTTNQDKQLLKTLSNASGDGRKGSESSKASNANTIRSEDFNFENVDRKEIQTSIQEIKNHSKTFENIIIPSPPGMTFQLDSHIRVVDAFTKTPKNAIKNILQVSRTKIRVFAVSLDSIKLVSSSDLTQNFTETLHLLQFTKDSNSFFDPRTTTLYLLPLKSNQLCSLKLSPRDASVISEGISSFYHQEYIQNFKLFNIMPRNSLTDFYGYLEDTISHKMDKVYIFGMFRKSKFRNLMCLKQSSRERYELEMKRFFKQGAGLRQELKVFMKFDDYFKLKIFDYSKNFKLLCYSNNSCLFFSLIDFNKRKIIKSRSINIHDVAGDIEELTAWFDDPLQAEGEVEDDNDLFRSTSCKFVASTCSHDNSLFMHIVVKNLVFVVKLEDIFNSSSLRLTKRYKCDINRQSLLQRHDRKRLLVKNKGPSLSTYLNTLSWLDTETLEETKINQLEESKYFSELMNDQYTKMKSTFRLTDSLILIINPLACYIYDFVEGDVIARHRYAFSNFSSSRLKHIDNSFFWSGAKIFHIVQTSGQRLFSAPASAKVSPLMKKSGVKVSLAGFMNTCSTENYKAEEEVEEDFEKEDQNLETSEVIQRIHSVYFNDIYKNLSRSHGSFTYNTVKLPNKNFLMICSKYFEEAVRANYIDPNNEQIMIELNPRTLQIVKIRRNPCVELGHMRNEVVFGIQNYLICSTRVHPTDENRDVEPSRVIQRDGKFIAGPDPCYRLSLLNYDFEIIDRCPHTILNNDASIWGLSDTHVISMSKTDHFYLHTVDSLANKLVLLKRVKIDAVNPLKYIKTHPGRFGVACFVKFEDQIVEDEDTPEEGVGFSILKFNSELELEDSYKIVGFPIPTQAYCMRDNKVCLTVGDLTDFTSRIYVLDLVNKRVDYAGKTLAKYGLVDFASGVDEEYAVQTEHEFIRKIVLTG